MEQKVKVLVADDSLVSQKLLSGLIRHDDRFELVGVAGNGEQTLELAKSMRPDVISMDINMPLMDGIEATRRIMQDCPVPILIVSGLYSSGSVEMAMEVLKVGAVGIMPKPHGPGHSFFAEEARAYLRMLFALSAVKVVTRKRMGTGGGNVKKDSEPTCVPADIDYKVLVIGASAGGPEAVNTILQGLRPGLRVPVLVVQHIDPHFAEGYAQWLASGTRLPVRIAKPAEALLPGVVYLPPGNKHLVLSAQGMVALSDDPPVNGHRPAVAELFNSAANVYRRQVVAVILSGMGRDGAAEMKKLRDMGALTIAQNEESCLVYGMPGEAVKLGAVVNVLSPVEIINLLNEIL